ncbi:MAG: HipA domain-containing protein [Sulfurimonas sp.]|nr:HipA domain-containing protein [Sulfurimonas sp.]
MTKSQKIIVDLLEEKVELTLGEMQTLTQIPKSTLIDNLKKLLKDEKINKVGKGKGSYYQRVYKDELPLKSIVVFKNGEKVGHLNFGGGLYEFKYYDNYKGGELLGLPKDVITKAHELFTVFENLIPEYARREKLLGFDKAMDLADTLVKLKNTHGSYDFLYSYDEYKYKGNYSQRKNWTTVKNKILGEHEYPNILEFDILIDDEIIEAASKVEHSHLSGNQNKIDISIDFENHKIVENLENADYLMKPHNPDIANYFNSHKQFSKSYYPYISVNEHLFMSFAKNELGFNVPYSALVKAKDEFHYIAKRYDRHDNFKYEQYDYAQYLGIKSENKYKSSSEELFEAINKTLYTKKEKLEALRFYFYSFVLKHSDLHLKNMGFLNIGRDKMILTPLYDVISVGLYNNEADDIGLSINVPYKHQKKNFRVSSFYHLADIVGVDRAVFKNEAKTIVKTFIDIFPTYIEMTKKLLEYDDLKIYKTRNSKTTMLHKLAGFYNKRVERFKKLGILEELGLNEYESLLKNENRIKI